MTAVDISVNFEPSCNQATWRHIPAYHKYSLPEEPQILNQQLLSPHFYSLHPPTLQVRRSRECLM